MRRNTAFSNPERHPGRADLALRDETVTGPLHFFNPTKARFHLTEGGKPATSSGAQVQWNSRDNRKGRHVLVVKQSSPLAQTTRASSHPLSVLRGLGRMCTVFPYWDISWLIAVLFTVGCMIFIVCGLFYWLPIAYPSTRFPNEDTIAGGLVSFVGGTLFQIGAVLLVFEAVNEHHSGCFGWALERAVTAHGHEHATGIIREDRCDHPHRASKWPLQPMPQGDRGWRWVPSWTELTTHYVYEIGFWASVTMTLGATIFYINAIMSMSWIYARLSPGVIDGVYYLSYLVGGVLFVVSSVFYLLETQPNWYTPAPQVLGWHIGVWNLLGSLGWTLAAAFGYCSAAWCPYQSDLTLIWASAAFTIGSAILWYESLDKYPVIMERGKSMEPAGSEEGGEEGEEEEEGRSGGVSAEK